MSNDSANGATRRVECPAEREPAVKTFIIACVFLGAGIWCWIDDSSGKYLVPIDPNQAQTQSADEAEVPKRHPTIEKDGINTWATWAFNYYGKFVFTIIGAAFAGRGVRAMNRVLIADEEGIGYKGGRRIAWSDVKGLDASDLADKQILRVKYNGNKTLELDNYKLQNFKELVAFVEQHAPGSTGQASPPPNGSES
jgi:hypothetical protein